MSERGLLYFYRATLISVVDGDTLDLEMSLGLDIYTNQRIRLYGIDTPEMNSRDPDERMRARAAKEFVIAYLPAGPKQIILETFKDSREKYGRYLAVVSSVGESQSLNDALVEAGLAVPYVP